jgi:hypothetical protein
MAVYRSPTLLEHRVDWMKAGYWRLDTWPYSRYHAFYREHVLRMADESQFIRRVIKTASDSFTRLTTIPRSPLDRIMESGSKVAAAQMDVAMAFCRALNAGAVDQIAQLTSDSPDFYHVRLVYRLFDEAR